MLVERTTLFGALAKMDNASAEAAVAGFGSVLNRIDAQRRLSLTHDQGREMAQHERLSEITGVAVYFTDPHSPWQRGIIENTNGLPLGLHVVGRLDDDARTLAWAHWIHQRIWK